MSFDFRDVECDLRRPVFDFDCEELDLRLPESLLLEFEFGDRFFEGDALLEESLLVGLGSPESSTGTEGDAVWTGLAVSEFDSSFWMFSEEDLRRPDSLTLDLASIL